MQAAKKESIAEHADYDIEYRIITPEQEVRWIQSRGQASYRPDGTPTSMNGISLDITERKRAEEHRDLLARELGHRAKNMLATVQSIVHQSIRHASTLEDAKQTIDARIQSLSGAHDVLMREDWDGATMTEVVAVALRPFGTEQHSRFKVAGPPTRLPSRTALALAMALHELATNAVKYGALSNDTGQVCVHWGITDDAVPARLWFRWSESGGPTVIPPTRTGFGSRMIKLALANELGGTAEIDFQTGGVVFVAEAPLPIAATGLTHGI